MRSQRSLGFGACAGALLVALAVPRHALANEPPSRVSVLTMGPGQHPFTRFGHNAILLEWQGSGQHRDAVYNFGTFEFDGMKGVEDFMAGRFRYWLSVGTLQHTLRVYAADHRSLTAQELELTARERATLADALAKNVLPEHRYYDYDYYRDNCSTRVRDALDQLLGGSLRSESQGPGRLTFRQHTLRLVGDTPWLYAGLDLALGAPTNRPTTRWDELFLPQELHDQLARTPRELAGQRVPLVRAERRLLDANVPAPPRQPPERRPQFAGVGIVLGGALAALGRAPGAAARVVFGVVLALLGTSLGLLGCVFGAFWLFSKHWAAHQNPSLLLCPPWALGLGVLGIAFALGRPSARRRVSLWLAAVAGASTLALLLAVATASLHETERLALLVVPLWLGLLFGARTARRAV